SIHFISSKCLPCLHTFCFQCLSKYGADEVDGDKLPCPVCRQEFVIPEGGFEMLQNNFFILQLMSCHTCETETQNPNLACQMCVEEDRDGGSQSPVTKYCMECDQNMCHKCAKIHGNLKYTRSHKVVSSNDKQQISVLIRNRPSECEVHENSQLSLYCKDCKQTICLLCRATKHEGHNCTDFQEAMQKFTEELNKFCPDLNECL